MIFRKLFPSKINWVQFWRNRWIVLDILNQVAYGTVEQAVETVRSYGGHDQVGVKFFNACKEIIKVDEDRR
jgi:hypothetical protein